MIRSGLVSVTFRKQSPQEVIALAVKAKLAAIEWGGDVHVPHGDVALARTIGEMTRQAGLAVAAYGSYYRVGHDQELPAEPVLASAKALGSPLVRVWAGKLGSGKADADYRRNVVQESRRLADLAADMGLLVAYEFHGGTLTDTTASARMLLEEVNHPNVKSYWQPPVGASVESCLEGIDAVLPWLCNVHVFHWLAEPKTRLALRLGQDLWSQYLARIKTCGRDLYAMLEFVRDDSPEALADDAVALRELLAAANGNDK